MGRGVCRHPIRNTQVGSGSHLRQRQVMVFDVDVNGGLNIKRFFGADALAIFVMPPSIEVLEQRLRGRGTESEESIQKRLSRSAKELGESSKFDVTIVNDDLARAVEETRRKIEEFLSEE